MAHPQSAVAAPDTRAIARSSALVLVLIILVAAAVAGLRLGLQLVAHRAERAAEVGLAAPTRSDLGPGQPVRTSFGALTVNGTEVNNGLTTADLGGMSHGVSSLVKAGRAQIEVTLTFANSRNHPVLISADQFRLVTRRAGQAASAPLKPTGTTLLPGPLPAGAGLDTRVAFVVPTDGALLELQYTDPAWKTPIRVALGRTDKLTAPAEHQH